MSETRYPSGHDEDATKIFIPTCPVFCLTDLKSELIRKHNSFLIVTPVPSGIPSSSHLTATACAGVGSLSDI